MADRLVGSSATENRYLGKSLKNPLNAEDAEDAEEKSEGGQRQNSPPRGRGIVAAEFGAR